ncbi:hypothetical protein Spb1_14890 [Planctopirus ephydatiae]|uniref:Uncharacterized protein n=1 Tax=Planctopirus ephydatiae TaxID=2528019 RepID=A0A518GLX6_9PLAN|nr:hypothetical protein Spb1_14890 [Planctopirus ephydatiae]
MVFVTSYFSVLTNGWHVQGPSLCTFSDREEPDGQDPDGHDLLEREVSADKSRYHPFNRVYQVAYDPQGLDLRFHAKAPSKAFVS